MIKCENLSLTDLQKISEIVAEAFLGEKGCFTVLSMESAVKMFRAIVKLCYEEGHLYTTSGNFEGICVYWTKSERPGLLPQAKLLAGLIKSMSLKEGKLFKEGQSNWKPTEKRYKKAEDFVEVFLIAVRKDCQGKGYFKSMISEPFELAEKRGTICVLDTDSEIKAGKYQSVGMHIVARKIQRNGNEMFAMEK